MRRKNYVAKNTRMLKVRFGQLKLTCDTRVIYFDDTLEQV